MEQRIPPQNVEAEQAVLGAMMLDHNAVITAMEVLQPHVLPGNTPDHF